MKHFRRLTLLLILWLPLVGATVLLAQKQRGRASYYANKFHGRRTSSGLLYHKDSLTCAHRTLPFGTLLHVRNLANDKSVVVKVTDRGPFVRGRIIDLSYAAAQKIGMIASGHATVEIEPVDQMREERENGFTVPTILLPDLRTGEAHTAAEWKRIAEAAKNGQKRTDSLSVTALPQAGRQIKPINPPVQPVKNTAKKPSGKPATPQPKKTESKGFW